MVKEIEKNENGQRKILMVKKSNLAISSLKVLSAAPPPVKMLIASACIGSYLQVLLLITLCSYNFYKRSYKVKRVVRMLLYDCATSGKVSNSRVHWLISVK